MRIACVSYRKWALDIYDYLMSNTDHTFLIIRSKKQYDENAIRDFKPDYVLFYGWSWIIAETLLNDITCIMLHPSPLPKYRGGSPIQNQIIAGESTSMVTLFKMNESVDAGDIYYQKEFSLEGSLDDIFLRITDIGTELSIQLFTERKKPVAQYHTLATYYKRRKSSESEITIEEMNTKAANYLYNKIRMLADPYPNAFIRTIDGKKLLIKVAEIKEDK
jgi:methionyl-tRNA formyltransferase